MSIESDFHSLLAARAELVALVGAKGIAQEAVNAGSRPPYLVYTAEHQLEHNLLGDLVDDTATLQVQCWGRDPLQADAVAEQVLLAIDAAPAISYALVIARQSAFDPELDLHATVLTVEWSAAL
jgi:hypothetical protein